MNDFSFIDEELDLLIKQGLKREIKTVSTASGPWVALKDTKRVLQFASNNYLGLANHPEVINAGKTALSKFGAGGTGSRLLSGSSELHEQLEKLLADFEGTESAVFFNSGYSAIIGVITALTGKEDVIYSDEYNHASIIDGIRLSRATKFIYAHNDANQLEKLVVENKNKFKRNFIITDTVFSMDGDIAPLKDIASIAKKNNCITLVDEAHAIGIFGEKSTGVVEELKLEDYFPLRVGTCSKAIGVEGGFCVGPKNVIELLRNKARAFMFSTSSSPAVIGSILKSLDFIRDGNWRKERLWQNAKYLYSGLKKNYKLKLNEFKTPIIIVFFNTIEEARDISQKLFDECHIWAPGIRPPTVKQPRIRMTPIATHSEDDLNYVIKAFDYLSKDIKAEPIIACKS